MILFRIGYLEDRHEKECGSKSAPTREITGFTIRENRTGGNTEAAVTKVNWGSKRKSFQSSGVDEGKTKRYKKSKTNKGGDTEKRR